MEFHGIHCPKTNMDTGYPKSMLWKMYFLLNIAILFPIPSMYGIFTYIYHENQAFMQVNIPVPWMVWVWYPFCRSFCFPLWGGGTWIWGLCWAASQVIFLQFRNHQNLLKPMGSTWPVSWWLNWGTELWSQNNIAALYTLPCLRKRGPIMAQNVDMELAGAFGMICFCHL